MEGDASLSSHPATRQHPRTRAGSLRTRTTPPPHTCSYIYWGTGSPAADPHTPWCAGTHMPTLPYAAVRALRSLRTRSGCMTRAQGECAWRDSRSGGICRCDGPRESEPAEGIGGGGERLCARVCGRVCGWVHSCIVSVWCGTVLTCLRKCDQSMCVGACAFVSACARCAKCPQKACIDVASDSVHPLTRV